MGNFCMLKSQYDKADELLAYVTFSIVLCSDVVGPANTCIDHGHKLLESILYDEGPKFSNLPTF